MPSLLVNRKMRPELRARVLASVRGQHRAPGTKLAPRAMSVIRLGTLASSAILTVWFGLSLRRAQRELESERAALIERVRHESADLSPDEKAAASRILPWLALFSGRYEGDLVSEELRGNGSFTGVLSRPTVYVRGPLSSFAAGAQPGDKRQSTAKDAFVLCLIDPPAERNEKLLRSKARAAFTGSGPRMAPTSHVETLHSATLGLPFLSPEWQASVRAADDRRKLEELRKDLDRAPLEAAKRAAKATQLLLVIDEPSDKTGPSELDGERPHDVRVGIVALGSRKVLLRLRRRVDPSWLSADTRAEFARGADSCALALDVHAAVGAREVAVGD